MKRIFLLLAFAGTFAAANAQTKVGVKGGLNLNNWGGADVENNNARIGFHVGGFASFGLADKVSVQPELLYSVQGTRIELPGDDTKFNFGYLNIPVMLKYEIVDGFSAQVGPQFGFLLSAKAKRGDDKVNVKKYYKTFDLGLGIGAAYQLPSSPLGVDVRYNLGLSRIDDEGDAKVFNRVLQVGVFYTLSSRK